MLRRHSLLGSLNFVSEVSPLCHLNPGPEWCSSKMETHQNKLLSLTNALTENAHIWDFPRCEELWRKKGAEGMEGACVHLGICLGGNRGHWDLIMTIIDEKRGRYERGEWRGLEPEAVSHSFYLHFIFIFIFLSFWTMFNPRCIYTEDVD